MRTSLRPIDAPVPTGCGASLLQHRDRPARSTRPRAWLVGALCAVCAGALHAQGGPNVTLSTSQPMGTSAVLLDALGDASTPAAFDLSAEQDLWALEFKFDPGGGAPLQALSQRLTPSNCSFSAVTLQVASSSTFTATWSDGSNSLLGSEQFDIVVHGQAGPASNVFELSISVITDTPSFTLSEVEFPRVRVASPNAQSSQPTDTEVLTYPLSQGIVVLDPVQNLPATAALLFGWNPGALSMQWVSYYDEAETNAPVLFFGTRDVVGYTKEYDVGHADGSAFSLSVKHTPEDDTVFDNDYVAPFPAVLGVVRGDWFSAAKEYRDWVLDPSLPTLPVWLSGDDANQLEPLALRDQTNGGNQYLSRHLREAQLSLVEDAGTNRSNFAYWDTDIDDHRSVYGLSTTPSIVYNWHAHAMGGSAVGDWLTPDPNFTSNPKPSHSAWSPYVNFETYGSNAASYTSSYVPGFLSASLAPYRRFDENGQPVLYAPGSLKNRMCLAAYNGTSNYGIECMQVVSAYLQSLNAGGMYLDETSFEGAPLCYASHGHPVGGGRWSIDARRAALRMLLSNAVGNDPDFYLVSESNSEATLDLIQLASTHASADVAGATGTMFTAPLYAAVYHDYQLTGRLMSWSNNPGGHVATPLARRVLAYSGYFGNVLSGGSLLDSPSIAQNMTDHPGYGDYAALLSDTLAVTKLDTVRRFVHFGSRLRDPQSTAARIPVSAMAPGWWLAYAGDSADQPLCFISAWGDPLEPDDFGVMLTNWTAPGESLPGSTSGGAQSFWITIDANELGVTPGTFAVHQVTSAGDTYLSNVSISPSLSVPLTIPALSSQFFRFERL